MPQSARGRKTRQQSTQTRQSTPTHSTSRRSALPDFVSIVERYQKSVVGIEVVHEQNSNRMFSFGMPWERTTPFRSVNIGTGFIFHRQGYILTNEHVIHDASRVNLRYLGRKKPVTATVVGTDYLHDIAVLKADVPFTGHVLKIRKERRVQPGEWVLAIGSPLTPFRQHRKRTSNRDSDAFEW